VAVGERWEKSRPAYHPFLFCIHELLPGKRIFEICIRTAKRFVGEVVEARDSQ
jgi:hypothetical protein